MKRLAVLVSLSAAVALAGCGGGSNASRPPTAAERAALLQATFDYFVSDTALARFSVTRLRVHVLPRAEGLKSHRVTKYALIELRGFDRKGKSVGDNVAVAVYFSTPQPGWHVFDNGSADVGCDPRWYPPGQGPAIRKAFAMTCP